MLVGLLDSLDLRYTLVGLFISSSFRSFISFIHSLTHTFVRTVFMVFCLSIRLSVSLSVHVSVHVFVLFFPHSFLA